MAVHLAYKSYVPEVVLKFGLVKVAPALPSLLVHEASLYHPPKVHPGKDGALPKVALLSYVQVALPGTPVTLPVALAGLLALYLTV